MAAMVAHAIPGRKGVGLHFIANRTDARLRVKDLQG